MSGHKLSFEERLKRCDKPILKKLYHIILVKKSLLCVAADFTNPQKVIKLAEAVGDHICILKLHTDLLESECSNLGEFRKHLWRLSRDRNFLIFEDRNFYDGAKTIELAYRNIVKFVDLVSVIPISDDIMEAIERVAKEDPSNEPKGCLAVCDLSYRNNVPNTSQYLELVERNGKICCGIVGQFATLSDRVNFIKLTPGVRALDSNEISHCDTTGQKWHDPRELIKRGSDILVVGRSITSEPEDSWGSTALSYKELAFSAYLQQLEESF